MASIDFDMLFNKIDSGYSAVSKKTFNVFKCIPNFDEALLHKILAVCGYYDDDGTFYW